MKEDTYLLSLSHDKNRMFVCSCSNLPLRQIHHATPEEDAQQIEHAERLSAVQRQILSNHNPATNM